MHGWCKSLSDAESYIIIVLAVLLVFHGEVVGHVRKDPTHPCIYMLVTKTYINLHSSSIREALDVLI